MLLRQTCRLYLSIQLMFCHLSVKQMCFIAHAKSLSCQRNAKQNKDGSLHSPALLQPSSFRFILHISPPHPPTCHLPIFPPLLLSHTSPSVFTSCVPFSRGACLSSAALCATDSLTITLEEIPRVACQSQLAANPNWVERSIFLYKSWNMAVSKLLASRAPREQPYK